MSRTPLVVEHWHSLIVLGLSIHLITVLRLPVLPARRAGVAGAAVWAAAIIGIGVVEIVRRPVVALLIAGGLYLYGHLAWVHVRPFVQGPSDIFERVPAPPGRQA